MGWFWSEEPCTPEDPIDALNNRSSEQPFGGVFWAVPVERAARQRCPVDHTKLNRSVAPPASNASKCPVDHTKMAAKPEPASTASKCPVDHTKLMKKKPVAPAPDQDVPSHGPMNPMNNMPELHQLRVPGQKVDLPTERTMSSIPKGREDSDGVWEYPSPQQMLNAMVRKSGPEGIDEEAVESMVDVHNFLNEGVWREVLEWERPYVTETHGIPRLLKFQGRPDEMSPRATMLQWLGKIYPSKFGFPAPFDRHDWTVLRQQPNGEWKQVRYVIDFYEGPDDEDDLPTFSVDVRPAADSFENVRDRIIKATAPVWNKAMGYE